MIPLVTTDYVKEHLHVSGMRFNADIDNKILAASAIIFNFLKIDSTSPESYPWDGGEDEVPADIQIACCLIIGRLNQDREGNDPILTDGIKDLLRRWRDPAMA